MEVTQPDESRKIRLDVGGKLFSTSLGTLLSLKGNFFEAMFSGRVPTKPDTDGAYFIDRDPKVFRYVLNYLRGSPPNVSVLSLSERHDLLEEAKYYRLDGLVELLSAFWVESQLKVFSWKASPNYTISDDLKTVTKATTAFPDEPKKGHPIAVITNECVQGGNHSLGIKLEKITGAVAVGLINPYRFEEFDPRFGYYVHVLSPTHYRYYSEESFIAPPMLRRIGEGDIVKLHLHGRKLSLSVNGTYYMVFPELNDEILCPMVTIQNAGDTISFVEYFEIESSDPRPKDPPS